MKSRISQSFSHFKQDVNQYFEVNNKITDLKYGVNNTEDCNDITEDFDFDTLSLRNEVKIILNENQKLGPWGTYFTLLKAYVCTGCLYLPRNMINGGYLWSSFTVVLCGYLTTYCTMLLIETSRKT